jgi:hypothetical protein
MRRGINWTALGRMFPAVLASWFIAISLMRIALIAPTGIGFDGRLYRLATATWLGGGDPWHVSLGGVFYAAPPPSLLPFVPLTWLPEDAAIGLLITAAIAANVFAIRRLGLPLWWLAFPPLVDGIWNANVHVFVVPLVLVGLAPIATLLKIYAAAVPFVRGPTRAWVLSIALIVAVSPVLPWGLYLGELPSILQQLRQQSGGGISVTAFPPAIALLMAVVALFAMRDVGRERSGWFFVPVLWPSTQWYYGSLALPGATSFAAAILAVPLVGGPFLALVDMAIELRIRRRRADRQPTARAAESR